MLTVQFMQQIWAGALASELVSCVDGLLLGPPKGWSEGDEDDDEGSDGDGDNEFGESEEG